MFQIDKIQMTLPNVHYIDVDYARFPKLEFTGCDNQVKLPGFLMVFCTRSTEDPLYITAKFLIPSIEVAHKCQITLISAEWLRLLIAHLTTVGSSPAQVT